MLRTGRLWMLVDKDAAEVCLSDPKMDEDLVVIAEPTALAQWHLGQLGWSPALRAKRNRVTGPLDLACALPTWNKRSVWAA